jgi:hypothetical protein
MNFSIKQAGAPIAPAAAEPVSNGPRAANDQVWQPPDDAVLRRRAYFSALDRARGKPTRPLATDRTA